MSLPPPEVSKVTTTRVWCDPDTAVQPGARVQVWPDTPHTRTSAVIAVTRLNHPRTPSHTVLDLA